MLNESKNVHISINAFHLNNLCGIHEEYISMYHLFIITVISECFVSRLQTFA